MGSASSASARSTSAAISSATSGASSRASATTRAGSGATARRTRAPKRSACLSGCRPSSTTSAAIPLGCQPVPPEPRLVPRFAAEPPQDVLPYGRWAERLRSEFLAAAADLDDVGEPGELVFYPDRTWHGRTWVPVTAPTSAGLELVGFVSFRPAYDGGDPTAFNASADATDETAAHHPEWQIDLNEEVVGSWRGEEGHVAAMTLVWG